MLKIHGWNDFYEGWISQIFQRPFDTAQPEAWQVGWKMAEETGSIAATAIPAEIKLGHLIVEYEHNANE
jgi:hypothetical protein